MVADNFFYNICMSKECVFKQYLYILLANVENNKSLYAIIVA